MLQDVDRTLEKLLYERGKINKKDVEIAFETPTGEWSARLSRPTLNLWCFDLRENIALRTSGMRVERNTSNNSATRSFPERRIDVTYLVTAWARDVQDEHQLLWRALATLKNLPVLKPDDCEGALRYQTRSLPTVTADMNELHANVVDLWGVLDNQMKAGFLFKITVELEVEAFEPGPLVLRSSITVGQSEEPAQRKVDQEDVKILYDPDKKEERRKY